MAKETEGQRSFREDLKLALRLLDQGYSPEEVEEALASPERRLTALTDPNNVLMQEVTEDGAAPGTR